MTTKKTATSTIEQPAIEVLPNEPAAAAIAPLAVGEIAPEAIVEADPYMDDSYSDPDAQYPRIQTLRGEGNQPPCWFIPEDQLDRSGWLDYGAKLTTYHFASGDKEDGLVILQPRLLVAAKTSLLAFDRTASQNAGRMMLAGDYNNIAEEAKTNFGMVQFFRLYLLDDQNCPLAEMPFEYRAKGATRSTFVAHWNQSCDEITRLHCRSLGKPFARRNATYRSLCVFAPKLAKEKVETDKVNVLAAKVVDHVRPTADDWVNYFLGRNENADWFTDVMAAEQPLISGLKSVQAPAELPAGKELLALPG
jgi:Family of unknown function (DUF5895)